MHAVIVPCPCIKSLITVWCQLHLSLTGICFANKNICLRYSYLLKLLNFCTSNRYPVSFSYQQLLSPYYAVAVKATPQRYSFQTFLPVTPSYSYQQLVRDSCDYSLLYQLLLTVSVSLINQSFQPLFSGTAIR